MKHKFFLLLFVLAFLSLDPTCATVPETMNYQGSIHSQGHPFTGQGAFRFAIVDSATTPWTTVHWSNDGNSSPETDIVTEVTDGLFSVTLGEPPQTPIPASVFTMNNLFLAIWFNDGINGHQLLEPNQQLNTVPFAFRATQAENAQTIDNLDSSNLLRNDEDGQLTGNLEITESITASGLTTANIRASDDFSVATVDFDTLPNSAQYSGITIGKTQAEAGLNNGQPYLWLRGNGAHSWILDHTGPGTLWAQSMGAYYNNVKQGNIGFFGTGPTVDYLSVGFNGYAWWNDRSRFMIWHTGRAEFMPEEVVGQESQVEPSAWLVLAPGQSTANSAPLKFKPGELMTTSESGALEYDGTDLYLTDELGIRRKLATDTPKTAPEKGFTGTQDIVTQMDQDPITGEIAVRTQTLHIEDGIIVDID